MGWTGIPLSNIGGKATTANLKKYFEEQFEVEKHFSLKYFAKKGNALYMAIERKMDSSTVVYAQIVKIAVEDGWFEYKEFTEFSGPFFYDAPAKLLKMLSPTDDETALSWRKECKEKAEQLLKKKIVHGSIIQVKESEWDRLPEGYGSECKGKLIAIKVVPSILETRKVTAYVPFNEQKTLKDVKVSDGTTLSGFQSKIDYRVEGKLI